MTESDSEKPAAVGKYWGLVTSIDSPEVAAAKNAAMLHAMEQIRMAASNPEWVAFARQVFAELADPVLMAQLARDRRK